jgi:hypothetical protein
MFLTASNDQATNPLFSLYQVQVFVFLFSLYMVSEGALFLNENNSIFFVGGGRSV